MSNYLKDKIDDLKKTTDYDTINWQKLIYNQQALVKQSSNLSNQFKNASAEPTKIEISKF